MASRRSASVNATDLRGAFEFVSAGSPFENAAYVCRDTGKVFWAPVSGLFDAPEPLPEDIDNAERYLAVPHKADLNLGSRLVFDFVDEVIPDDVQTVAGYFQRRGAYGRFKDLQDERGMIEGWYAFEERRTEEALATWCAAHGMRLVGE